jgi:hypothetical protein
MGKAKTDVQLEACDHGELALMPGVIVHYVLGTEGPGNNRRGEVRPAVVVRVLSESADQLVQLQVFLDGSNDDPIDGAALTWRSGVPYAAVPEDGGALVQDSWHWPHEGWQPSRTVEPLRAALGLSTSVAS